MKRILVTGATGNLGQAVVGALKAKGITVRAAARDPGKVTRSAGVEAVSFDYSKPVTGRKPTPFDAFARQNAAAWS
jgi:uncharacterized protein YbjT (DUF2867 family)